MLKNSFIVTFFLLLSSILGFFAQILFARLFGTSAEMDIYFKLLSVPTIITGLVPVVFTSVLLPSFAKFGSDEDGLGKYIRSLWIYVVLFSILFTVFGCLITIYRLCFIDNISEILKNTAVKVSIMIWIGSGLFILSSYFSTILNYHKQFIKVAWVSVLPPIFTILFVFLFHNYIGVVSIALAVLIAGLVQFVIFFKQNISKFPLNIYVLKRIPNMKQLLYHSFLVVLSLLPFTVFVTIGYFCASTLGEGSVSYLGYSQSFSGFLSVATSMGVAIVSFPNLVDDHTKGNVDNSLAKFEMTLRYVLLISIFITSAFICLRIPILTLLYKRGSFTDESVIKLANIIPWYLISAVFIAGLNLLRTLFYTTGKFKSLAVLGVAGSVFFYISANVLSQRFSIVGIAIANSVSFFILFCFSILLLQSKKSKFLTISFMFFLMKNVVIAAVSILIVVYFSSWIFKLIYSLWAIIICLIVFSVLYYFLSKFIFKSKEVIEIEKIITNQLKLKYK
jgi:putative peptidoglycan lipid II flippase